MSTPYAVFDSFDKSIDFIYNYYYNPTAPRNSLLYSLYPNWDLSKDTNTATQMYFTWVYWWPSQNYQNKDELGNFLVQNKSTLAELDKSAVEVLQLSKSFDLI